MIFFGLRKIARPAVGDLIMVDVLVYRGYLTANARTQSSNKTFLASGGDTEYRETSKQRLSHIYIHRAVCVGTIVLVRNMRHPQPCGQRVGFCKWWWSGSGANLRLRYIGAYSVFEANALIRRL